MIVKHQRYQYQRTYDQDKLDEGVLMLSHALTKLRHVDILEVKLRVYFIEVHNIL